MFRSISEIEEFLGLFVAKSKLTTGKNVTVQRMRPLLEKVGNPHNRLNVIHVAGTSGKTSTVYYITNLLQLAGKQVGSTVSPHVYSLTERLQVNGEPVAELEFCDLFTIFMDEMGDDPDASYFELLIVFVLWVFDRKKVDYVVLETGLGGLHDGTNVCTLPNKICVITDIGYDHQFILGDTLGEISSQKAGIIHPSNQVFMYEQSAEVMEPVYAQVTKVGATLQIVPSKDNTESILPLYQQRNWSLAKAVFEYVRDREAFRELTIEELARSQVAVPGRMQYFQHSDKLFILDGAHNEQKMQAFVTSFQQRFPETKVPVLLVMKQDKDYIKAIELLKKVSSEVYCSEFSSSQDIPIVSLKASVLAEACTEAGLEKVHCSTSIEEVISQMLANDSKLQIITGSFYALNICVDALNKK